VIERCKWVNPQNELYVTYHDSQWGVPVHDDRTLFEMLILEGAQAGLSWETVLKKRENYRKAFKSFDPKKVALFTTSNIEELLQNEGIIRNRLKINAAIKNAQVFLVIQKEFGSFDRFIWSYVNHKPVNNHYSVTDAIPVTDEISDKISKDLKKRGMSFVGSTIIYAYMQAIGMINAHTTNCFRYESLVDRSGD
jgi:DNA-3-methyladenine glycosylase I